MTPYKMSLLQELKPDDTVARVQFTTWILQNQHILDRIIWSDKAYFSLDGTVNCHNCIIWAYENPHKVITKSLHSPKVCVWMGFSANKKLEPYFFDDMVDQNN